MSWADGGIYGGMTMTGPDDQTQRMPEVTPGTPRPRRSLPVRILKWVGIALAALFVVGIVGSIVAPVEPTAQTATPAAPPPPEDAAPAPPPPAEPAPAAAPPPPPPPAAAPPPAPAPAAPPPFEEVDPFTSPYFIALEGTGLAESQGEMRLYNLGVNTCRLLDAGRTVESEVTALAEESNLGDEAGSLVGAAVLHLCPQHEAAARAFAEGN
jgi:hypothetical protein